MDEIKKEWLKCPNCDQGSMLDMAGGSFLAWFGMSFFGEIVIWIIAGILISIFTMLDLETAYGLAIAILFIVAIHMFAKYKNKSKDYMCSECKQRFSLDELKEEYNKLFQSDGNAAT